MRERRLLQQAGDYVRLREETNVQRIDASRQIGADKKTHHQQQIADGA
jgi:hypothetical protein